MRSGGVKIRTILLMISLSLGGLLGCERDIPFVGSPDQPISGYQLEGYVTDRLGIPVKDLRIALWYDYSPVDDQTVPSRQFAITDSTKAIRVRVLDPENKVRCVLFEGLSRVGTREFQWDRKDSLGQDVASGVYRVEFSAGGIVRGSYTAIVDGAISAVTDSFGHYLIPNSSIPVGFFPAPLYSSSDTKFIGNYIILSDVRLEFILGNHRSAIVNMNRDLVTRFDFRI
jgi:hypothetical protein